MKITFMDFARLKIYTFFYFILHAFLALGALVYVGWYCFYFSSQNLWWFSVFLGIVYLIAGLGAAVGGIVAVKKFKKRLRLLSEYQKLNKPAEDLFREKCFRFIFHIPKT